MIELQNITKKYNDHYALNDVSLKFNKQETVAIIGSSGSGKSTLLRCINHLEVPDSGKVIINGIVLTSNNAHKLSLTLGMVFQNFNLFPHMSVEKNLIYAPVNVLKQNSIEAKAKAKEILSRFNLQNKLFEKPANLSGGQKQRIAICRALMMSPETILLDEPTSALDPEVIKDIIDVIIELKHDVTMLVVTHHLKFAEKIADRIIFMDKGKVLSDQEKKEFFVKPKSHRARLFLENIGDLM